MLPDDILRLETNFTVINETVNETINETETNVSEHSAELNETTNQTKVYEFNDLCIDTCNILETSNPILIIELEENTTLTITQITITQTKENNAPEQIKQIPDITITTGQTASLNLDDYFSDPDDDTTHYDINEIPEVNAEITQNTLNINSNQPGTYIAYIYATDGDKLTTSNTFQIEITTTETNITINETINITETNVSEYPTELNITPIETINLTDPCKHPDINQRPSYCFVGIEDKAFEELTVQVQNKKRGRVGLFTRFGNLIIRGLLIQNSTGTPNKDDFQIGFTEKEEFAETITSTAWIDTETGNLYLKGRVYENQEILEPTQFNTFIIKNGFGLILGYFDKLRGDLYLRGNIVQLGKV